MSRLKEEPPGLVDLQDVADENSGEVEALSQPEFEAIQLALAKAAADAELMAEMLAEAEAAELELATPDNPDDPEGEVEVSQTTFKEIKAQLAELDFWNHVTKYLEWYDPAEARQFLDELQARVSYAPIPDGLTDDEYYFKEICRTPLLNGVETDEELENAPAEETGDELDREDGKLGALIIVGKWASVELATRRSLGSEDDSQAETDSEAEADSQAEIDLQMAIEIGEEARAYLIQANLRLARLKALEKQNTSSCPLFDLIGWANWGLIVAADKYQPWRARFSTHATWWIRQKINVENIKNDRLIRIPYHMARRVFHFKREWKDFQDLHGHKPSFDDLAAMGYKREEAEELLVLAQEIGSLDAQVSKNEDSQFRYDYVAAAVNVPEEVAMRLLRAILEEELAKKLNIRDEQIVRLVTGFGLNNSEALNDVEIALLFGISRARVGQLRRKALGYLRSGSFYQTGRDYLNSFE